MVRTLRSKVSLTLLSTSFLASDDSGEGTAGFRNGPMSPKHQDSTLSSPPQSPVPPGTSTMLPHHNTTTVHYGASLQSTTHAIILLHGRGGTPASIAIPLITTFLTPGTESRLRIVAPAAQDRTWYPHVYTAAQSQNEPFLTGAIERVEREVRALEDNGITRDKIMIGGFSQGACLTARFLLKYPAKYWGTFVFSGAIPGLFSYVMETRGRGEDEFEGVDLRGTRVFVGCGDSDPLIGARAAEWTAWVFQRRGAEVTKRIYEGLGHSICKEELEVLKGWVQEMATEDEVRQT